MTVAGTVRAVAAAANDEAVIAIHAPRDEVWALVSDITNMPSVSPEQPR